MNKAILMVLALSLALGLFGCGRARKETIREAEPLPVNYNEAEPLLCLADSREEAEKIAELYGITLLSYEFGTAVFSTQEDPREVIRRGQEQGWPELSLNQYYEPH